VAAAGRGRTVAALLAALLLAGCGEDAEPVDPEAAARQQEACAGAVTGLVASTQQYIDAFGAPSGEQSSPDADTLTEAEYSTAVDNMQAFAASSGCDPEEFESAVSRGLREVSAPTALGRAILLQLRAGDAQGAPRTVQAAPGSDLAEVAAELPSGSTIELAAGSHELTDPLILLRGVTLRGAARDTTVLSSASPEGVLLVLTGAPSAVERIELRRTGNEPGAVLLVGPAGRLSLSDTRVTGARAGADGAGGAGILLAPSQDAVHPTGPQRPTTLRLNGSELVGNESAGLVVTAGHRAELESVTVDGAGQCGICFLAVSDGLVSDSTMTDNAVGVLVVGSARPAVTSSTVRGGEVAVQIGEQGQPVVQDNELSGSARAAVIATDQARGRLDGNRCSDVPMGIVVGAGAAPFVGENEGCPVSRGE
jgi:hypothetical protein